jgi:hypothetical protein
MEFLSFISAIGFKHELLFNLDLESDDTLQTESATEYELIFERDSRIFKPSREEYAHMLT